MIIVRNAGIRDFEPWSTAKHTKERIIDEGYADAFDTLIEEWYPMGLSETQLNDLLRFDYGDIYNALGMEFDEE